MNMNQTSDIASIVLENERRDREALDILLKRVANQPGDLLVEQTKMGGTDSFIASVSLKWVASNVMFASELPLFRERIDPDTNQIVPDRETIDLIVQRPLDWSRQAALVQYLATRRWHKFPPILATLTCEWVDKPGSPQWDLTGHAKVSSAVFEPLNSELGLGLLYVGTGITIYALDGQHRLMGIKGLVDLVERGQLDLLSKDAKPTKNVLTVDELVDEYKDVTRSYLRSLLDERIGIEIIPAVVPTETREDAQRRIRSVFVHVNRSNIPLSKGQLAQLDEDNGYAIVARRSALDHPLFKDQNDREGGLVNWNNTTIALKSAVLTTLKTLEEMATGYLEVNPEFSDWLPKLSGLIPLRPDDEELDLAKSEFDALLDGIASLPSMQTIQRGEADTGDYRRFQREAPPGKGHMLFRPVGQVALAQALGTLLYEEHMTLDELFAKLRAFDEEGQFAMDKVTSPWWAVLYDPSRERMQVSGRATAARLLRYLLGGMHDAKEQENLRQEVAKFRTNEGQLRDFDGTTHTVDFDEEDEGEIVLPEEFQLPTPIAAAR